VKNAATFGFCEGLIEINLSGYGDEDGAGRVSFKEDDLDWGDGEDSNWRFMRLAKSELEAIRDFLNQHMPAASVETIGRAIAAADGEDYMEDCERYDDRARAAIKAFRQAPQ